MPINIDKSKMGDVVKDFYKSDAPQFKGKSKEKRRQMAIAAKLSKEENKVNEGKLAKQWQQGAKRLKASGLEFVRGPEGVNYVKKNGKEIGTFFLDDGPNAWVVQADKWNQQRIVPDIDDIPALFESLLDKLKDRRKAKDTDKKIGKLGKIAANAYNKDDEKTGYRAMTLQRKMLRRKAGTELTRKLPEQADQGKAGAEEIQHKIDKLEDKLMYNEETEISEVSNKTLKSYIKKSTKRNKDFDDRDYQTGVKGLVKHAIKGKPTKAEYRKNVKRTDSEELARRKLRKRGYDDTTIAKPSHQRPQYEAKVKSTVTGNDIEDSGWRKATVRKDQYGNVIKRANIAKHLAKKGRAAAEKDKVSEATTFKVTHTDGSVETVKATSELNAINKAKKSMGKRFAVGNDRQDFKVEVVETSHIPHRGTLRDVKVSDKAKKGPKSMRDILKDLRAGKGKIEYMRKAEQTEIDESVEYLDEGFLEGIEAIIDYFKETKDRKTIKALQDAMDADPELAKLVKTGFNKSGNWKSGYRAKFERYVATKMSPEFAKSIGFSRDEYIENPNFMKKKGGLAGLMDLITFGRRQGDFNREVKSGKKIGSPTKAGRKMADIAKSRHKKSMGEDVEQIAELDIKTVKSYSQKSRDQSSKLKKGLMRTHADNVVIAKREKGQGRAMKKIMKHGRDNMPASMQKFRVKEEAVDQIDEISVGLRKRYIKKATAYKKKQPTPTVGRNPQADKDYAAYGKATKTARNKSINRSDGIERARSPMHYESVEKWIAVDTSSKSLQVYGPFSSKQKGEEIMKRSGVKSFKVVLQKSPIKEDVKSIQELTDKEKALIAKRKAINTRRGGGAKRVAAPKPVVAKKPSTKTSTIRDASERNIIMQLRKAQDVGGNHEIEFRRGTGTLEKGQIDTLLKVHDSLAKPQDKRKLRIAITQNADTAMKVAKAFQSKGH